jgi:hypothetical protein
MVHNNLLAQTTREASSDPTRKTFIAPALLPVCCVCSLIREKPGPFPDRERWVRPRAYQQTHGVHQAEVLLTHTYCPKCFTQVMDTVSQYLRTIGTPS